MRPFLLVNNLFIICILLQNTSYSAIKDSTHPGDEPTPAKAAPVSLEMVLNLENATGANITFEVQGSKEVTTGEAETRKIPHLVLNRNGMPTPGYERTIILSLGNLIVPPGGVYANLVIETQHGNPDLSGRTKTPMQVLNETRFIPFQGETQKSTSLELRIVFQRTFQYQKREIRTPTDYFSYNLRLVDAKGNLLKEFSDPYAFLMENQWRIPLPRVNEQEPGAAPQDLVLYFCDMIPFQRDVRDPESRIPRQDVEHFIQTELIPAMAEAYITQTNLWGLPWYKEWSNSRIEEDPKSLSVALAEHGTWFHGSPPSLGHSMISIRVDGGYGQYRDLTDGIMSIFHHELFHNQQRNISLHFGSKGIISGKAEAWETFSEGTAVLASLIGQPTIQFVPLAGDRSYLRRANTFIGEEGANGGGLNKSYKEVPYHTAIYWRYLYENCGGLKNGSEDPAAGMKVIRNILEALYSGSIVNINSSTDVPGAFPQVIDMALQATPSCAYNTYQESLVHFARSLYMLRLEEGRCQVNMNDSGCGFYDPNHLYSSPMAESYFAMDGITQINGSIPSSYGIDLLELELDPAAQGKSLKINLGTTSPSEEKFLVELKEIRIEHNDTWVKRFPTQAGILKSALTENGQLSLVVPDLDTQAYNGLGVIITRLDPHEDLDPFGEYTVQVQVQ